MHLQQKTTVRSRRGPDYFGGEKAAATSALKILTHIFVKEQQESLYISFYFCEFSLFIFE
jgi:hypothetical protein